MTAAPTLQTIRLAPKALLHDHLDGGLRPATVLDIAGQVGYDDLPATDVDALASWFRTQSHSGSLERYLEPFSHTVAVMQTPEALYRVAFECAQDLAADSVVYAEVRFAPELHISCGLSFDDVVDTVLTGFAAGEGVCRRWSTHHRPLSGHRDAARRNVPGDRRVGDPVPGQGSCRIRHRRRGGRPPANPALGCIRVHA